MSLFIFVGFTIFVFAPFELYMTNSKELWFSIYDFGPYLLVAFIAFVLFWLLVYAKFRQSFAVIDMLGYFAFLVVSDLYIQGNFLRTDYGQLDGQLVDWSQYRLSGMISIVCLLFIIGGGLFLWCKSKDRMRLIKATKVIAMCAVMVQITTLLIVAITTNVFSNEPLYVVTDKNEFDYSRNDNFIVLILDSYDSRVFDGLYNNGYKEELDVTFEDFTYYRNAVDVYSLTDFSVPQIITGANYLNQSTYGEYLEQSYESSTLINELIDKGYELNIYVKTGIPQGDFSNKVANWSEQVIGVSSHRRLLTYLYKLVGFRYLPQQLKQACWTYTEEIDDVKSVDTDNSVFEWANDSFYMDIANMKLSTEAPVAHIIHLRGIHVPRNCDSKLNRVEEQVDLYESAKGVNLMLNEYLNRLKELDIYDNANIVLLADHAANEYEELQFKQCPLLLVKCAGDNHEFVVEEVPVSYMDLQTGFCNLLNHRNTNIFELEDNERTRYHYEALWLERSILNDEFGNEFVEYKTTSHAFDSNSIVETGNKY